MRSDESTTIRMYELVLIGTKVQSDEQHHGPRMNEKLQKQNSGCQASRAKHRAPTTQHLLLTQKNEVNPGCASCVLCVKAQFRPIAEVGPANWRGQHHYLSTPADCLEEPPPVLFPLPSLDVGAANVVRLAEMSLLSVAPLAPPPP